jgi:hypothetical protein
MQKAEEESVQRVEQVSSNTTAALIRTSDSFSSDNIGSEEDTKELEDKVYEFEIYYINNIDYYKRLIESSVTQKDFLENSISKINKSREGLQRIITENKAKIESLEIQDTINSSSTEIVQDGKKRKREDNSTNPELVRLNQAQANLYNQFERLGRELEEIPRRQQEEEKKIVQYSAELAIAQTELDEYRRNKSQRGGRKYRGGNKDINKLLGQVVIVVYDKKQNKYYVSSYKDMFNLWFNRLYGSEQKVPDTVTSPQSVPVEPVVAKGVVTVPSWFQQANTMLKSDKRYQSLSQEKQLKIIKSYFENIKNNKKKQMNDVQAIQIALSTVFPVPLKITSGTSINDIKSESPIENQIRPMGMVRIGGLTRRKKYKNRVTKRRVNKKVRKTKRRHIKGKRITRRR